MQRSYRNILKAFCFSGLFGLLSALNAGAATLPLNQNSGPFTLSAGQSLTNGSYALTMQTDGNLVLYQGSTALWASSFQSGFDQGGFSGPTYGLSCAQCFAAFQGDGNLVLYNPAFNGSVGHAYWATNSGGNSSATLTVSPSRPYLLIKSSAGAALWSSSQMQTVVSLNNFMFVTSNGWFLQNPDNVNDVTDMHQDPVYGTWVWVDTAGRTVSDLLTNGGLNGITIDFIAPNGLGMMGVERNTGGDGIFYGYANPGLSPSSTPASFPPNTMPVNMNLPVLLPSQMAVEAVTPGAVQAFPWRQVNEFQMSPANCSYQQVGTLWTQNWVYLVASYNHGGDIGTPDLTLILETEQTDVDPSTHPQALRLERYAFVPGYGRVWQEVGYDLRTPQTDGDRTTWNVVVPNSRGHLANPICPAN
jgi:hypothetical protein